MFFLCQPTKFKYLKELQANYFGVSCLKKKDYLVFKFSETKHLRVG